MKRMLFNATQAEELRVAIVDGQKLMDLDIETFNNQQKKGNIYKGKITRIEPSLEACFVDYGSVRHGFLPFKEVSRSYFQDYEGGRVRIQDVLKEGMEILVQVEKDERGNKGAALTTFISLAGRYIVLMPNNPRGGGVSRRIEGEERQELKQLISQLDIPKGMSIIARTAGIGRSFEELNWDLEYLLRLWQAVSEAAEQKDVQHLILQESSLVIRAIRDYFQPDIGEILIDTDEVYEKVYQFMALVMPNNLARVKKYTDQSPLFSRFQVEHQIETAFSREVSLPSGGAIVIDHTEALVSVDVNSARSTRGSDVEETATKTNIEAAEEVARQIRLRDLGGLVVIDFIDMENSKNQRAVEQTLREALKQDRARVQMGKLSRFGLLELSRQRLQLSLGETSHMSCPRCHGTGFIRGVESSALFILRVIQEEAMKEHTGEIHVQLPVDVSTFLLNEKRADLFNLEENLAIPIILIPNIHLETPNYLIERIRVDELSESDVPSYKRVERPEDEKFVRSDTKAKALVNEAAVQGVKPNTQAPKVSQASLLSKLGSWFKAIFAAKEEPKKVAPKGRQNPSTRKKRTQHRKPQQKNTAQKNSGDNTVTSTSNAGHKNTNNSNHKNSNNPNQKNSSNTNSAHNKNASSTEKSPTKTNQKTATNKKLPIAIDQSKKNIIPLPAAVAEKPKPAAKTRTKKPAKATKPADSTDTEATAIKQAQESAPLVINLNSHNSKADNEQHKSAKGSTKKNSAIRTPRRRNNNRNRIHNAQDLMNKIDIQAIVQTIYIVQDEIIHGKQATSLNIDNIIDTPETVDIINQTAPAVNNTTESAIESIVTSDNIITDNITDSKETVPSVAIDANSPIIAQIQQVASSIIAEDFDKLDLGHLQLIETKKSELINDYQVEENKTNRRRNTVLNTAQQAKNSTDLVQIETKVD